MLKNPSFIFLLFLLIACRSNQDDHILSASSNEDQEDYDVIVVGGGMAGVTATYQLAKAGKKVLILQANNYIGGRIKTQEVTLLGGQTLNFQFGANWIHGSSPSNPITQLANQMGNVGLIWTNYSSLVVYDELGIDISQSADQKYSEYQEIFASFEELKNQKMSVEYVLRKEYPWTLQDKQFMFAVSNNFQFDQASPIGKVNSQFVQGLKWLDGEDELVMSGYQKLPQYLAEKSRSKVLLNHKVIQVSKSEKNERSTVKCQNGFQASAYNIVIAVPLGALKANKIKFVPELPNWKTQSIRKLGFGNIVKILIVPKKDLNLRQNTQFIGVVATKISERGSATFFLDFQGMVNKNALITFGLGANADELQAMPQGQLKVLIASRLSVLNTAPVSSSDFDIIRSTWKTDPSFGGAYSFPGLQTSIFEWKNMARPLQDRSLYFCGEHTYHTFRSTVNGAYLSGIVSANDILRSQKGEKYEEL